MYPPRLFGPYGRAALEYAPDYQALGANASWFHMFDESAFELCHRHGLAACVEFATFRADFQRFPELIPIGVDGQPIRYGDLVQGVCLSQQDFLAEREESLKAGLERYQPAGIWLDYLTYAGWFETPTPDLQESCFCKACIADFCDATGLDARSPSDILANHAQAWEQHKCRRIAAYARHYAALIKARLPECIVGAYMCPWTPEEHNRALTRIFAQDYVMLAESIDMFTPLIYCEKSGQSASWGRRFLEQAPEFVPQHRKVQLILDAQDGPASLRETAMAKPASWGLQVFAGTKLFTDPEIGSAFQEAVAQHRAG